MAHLARGVLLLDGLDDTDGHGLTHVTHGKASQRRVGSEGLHAHGLGGSLQHTGLVSNILKSLTSVRCRQSNAAILTSMQPCYALLRTRPIQPVTPLSRKSVMAMLRGKYRQYSMH